MLTMLLRTIHKRFVGAKKKSGEGSLQPTDFCVKAYGKRMVKVCCDYNPDVWLRRFEFRKLKVDDENNYLKEWLSTIAPGSRAVETVRGLEAGEVYVFRIVNIGRDNQRAYSEELKYVVPSADTQPKPEITSSSEYPFDSSES